MIKEIKGYHVFGGFSLAFGIIIAVNMTLAVNAVRSFPGLEVKNSYVASQSFEADRAAQMALGWDVHARVEEGVLALTILEGGQPVSVTFERATFGRATSVKDDQELSFRFENGTYVAPVVADGGNWNLRLVAVEDGGAKFVQRVIVEMGS